MSIASVGRVRGELETLEVQHLSNESYGLPSYLEADASVYSKFQNRTPL